MNDVVRSCLAFFASMEGRDAQVTGGMAGTAANCVYGTREETERATQRRQEAWGGPGKPRRPRTVFGRQMGAAGSREQGAGGREAQHLP